MKNLIKMRQCGDCKHWKRAVPHRWGKCEAPLPAWLDSQEYVDPAIFPDSEYAQRCPVYDARRDGEPRN